LWVDSRDVGASERDRFTLAIAEIVGNVVSHGALASADPPMLRLEVRVSGDRLAALIVDDGAPVVNSDLSAFPEDDLAEHGRGLPLAHVALDDLRYERRGDQNHWELTVLRPSNG
jgi:serine/threonine-protein kinase RsbW